MLSFVHETLDHRRVDHLSVELDGHIPIEPELLAGVRSQQIKKDIKSASMEQAPVSDQHTLTGDHSIIGTLYYIPPEGYADAQSAGKPWDVYSLGLVFYSFLTGNEDPLKYSKGIKRGKENPMSYALKIGGDVNKAPAISSEDPFIKACIEQDPRNKRIVEMLQKMTAFDPDERPTLEAFLQWIEEELDARSEKTLRAKKAEKKAEVASKGKRKATWAAGTVGVVLLGLLGSIPMINKSQRRDEFFRTQKQNLTSTDELLHSLRWNEAITLLEAQIKIVEDNGDLNVEEKQAQLASLREKLQHATTQLEKQTRAEELIVEGERFFHADGVLFAEVKRTLARATGQENPAPETVRDRLLEEAKRLYTEALQAGEGTQAAESAQRKLDQWHYQTGIRAYNRGNSFLAKESFAQISERSDEERVNVQSWLSSLQSWPAMEPDIRRRAEVIFSSGDRTSFSSAVRSLGPIKKPDDTYESYSNENFAILMKVQDLFDDWIATLTGEESNLDASQRIARDQMIQERLARMEILGTIILEGFPLVHQPLPESVQYLQTFFYGNLLIKESQITVALNNRNFDQAIQNYLNLLVYAEHLTALNQKEGIAFDPPEGMEGFLLQLLKNAMTSARDRLPPNKKAQLNGLLRERFQDEESFIRKQTAGYLD